MTRMTATPPNSHAATADNVRMQPSAVEISVLPVEVIALTQISATRKIIGGVVITSRRSARLVYRPARMQPATKLSPASAVRCSHPAVSVPGKNTVNITSPAPRAVSRAGAAPLPSGLAGSP
jgi:heme exporter protein D